MTHSKPPKYPLDDGAIRRLEKAYQDWLTTLTKGHTNRSRRVPLNCVFFPDDFLPRHREAECEDNLMATLVTLIEDAVKSSFEKGGVTLKPRVRVRRVIVHAPIASLVWSGGEAHWPVYLFRGRLSEYCKTQCHQDNKSKWKKTADDPRLIISPRWRREVLGEEFDKAREMPPCWQDCFLSSPDIPPCNYSDSIKKKSNDSKGQNWPLASTWTAAEILAMSRMRMRRWSIRKRDILNTPFVSETDNLDRISLFGAGAFGKNDWKIVSVARWAHAKRYWEDNKERYLSTFASESWEESRVLCKKLSEGSVTWPNKEEEKKELLRAIADHKEKSIKVMEAWPATQSPLPPLLWLNTELCGFNRGGGYPPLQGFFPSRYADKRIAVYFELAENPSLRAFLEKQDKGKWQSEQARKDRNGPRDNLEELQRFCRKVLIPRCELMKVADERWKNHYELEQLIPNELRGEIFTDLDKKREESRTVKEKVGEGTLPSPMIWLARLDDAALLFVERVHREEAPPAQLALAALGDIWKYAFHDVVKPRYAEFQRYQQLLRGFPDYRDHLTHSVLVYLLGDRICEKLCPDLKLVERYKKLGVPVPPTLMAASDGKKKEYERNVLRIQWAMTALMHDFALPVEKSSEVLQNLFGTFLGMKPEKAGKVAVKDVLKERFPAHRAFMHSLVNGRASSVVDGNKGITDITLGDFAYENLSDDHGFLSAAYLFGELFEKVESGSEKWWQVKEKASKVLLCDIFEWNSDHFDKAMGKDGDRTHTSFVEAILLEVLDAIAKHNAFTKELRLLFEGMWKPAYKFPQAFFSASTTLFNSPMPGLLMLCDNLCDWGRVVYPDDLRLQDRVDVEDATRTTVVRPEGLVTKVESNNGILKITVDYRWRLPFHFLPSKKISCLMDLYTQAAEEMYPYVPPFTPWHGCDYHKCKTRKRDDCLARKRICRFWTEVLGSEGKANRLEFPSDFEKSFNQINLEILFYGKYLCDGSLREGIGVKPKGKRAAIRKDGR